METIRSIVINLFLIALIIISCNYQDKKNNYTEKEIDKIYNEVLAFVLNNKKSILYIPKFPDGEIKQRQLSEIYSLKPIKYEFNSVILKSTGLEIDTSYYLDGFSKHKISINVSPFKTYMKGINLDSIINTSKSFSDNIFILSKWLNSGYQERGKSILLFTVPMVIQSKNKEYILVGMFSFYPYSHTHKYYYLLEKKDGIFKVIKRIKLSS